MVRKLTSNSDLIHSGSRKVVSRRVDLLHDLVLFLVRRIDDLINEGSSE